MADSDSTASGNGSLACNGVTERAEGEEEASSIQVPAVPSLVSDGSAQDR